MARTNCKSNRASRKYLHRGRNKLPPPVSTYRTDRPSVTQGRKRRWRRVLHALIPGERKAITAAAVLPEGPVTVHPQVVSACTRVLSPYPVRVQCSLHLRACLCPPPLVLLPYVCPSPPCPSVQTLPHSPHGQSGCCDVRGNPDNMCRTWTCELRNGGHHLSRSS